MIRTKKITVLIVEDALIFQNLIRQALNNDDRFEVIAVVPNPLEAVKVIQVKCPDVITLDIEMPFMNGLTFLDRIMEQHPIPAIMISSLTRDNKKLCLDALGKGAIDIIDKPLGIRSESELNKFNQKLINSVLVASEINRYYHAKEVQHKNEVVETEAKTEINEEIDLISFGASTGGTKAIELILSSIRTINLPPIVIAQHMPSGFTKLFSSRLDSISKLIVKEAANNEKLVDGTVYIAPGNYHLTVVTKKTNNGLFAQISKDSKVNLHRPSVDVMFNSIAKLEGIRSMNFLLTGMGDDGAKGLLKLKQQGQQCIIQDKASSVIYGMPYQAKKINAMNLEISLENIPNYVVTKAKRATK